MSFCYKMIRLFGFLWDALVRLVACCPLKPLYIEVEACSKKHPLVLLKLCSSGVHLLSSRRYSGMYQEDSARNPQRVIFSAWDRFEYSPLLRR
ncbi:hypothetical protein RJT34_16024 [Clitoria ternatea]|uniref:Secreted protein n=1 Tax=Clitoria ternatea TaxID=43366 RepID=A0AAN9PBZ1_CLITE